MFCIYIGLTIALLGIALILRAKFTEGMEQYMFGVFFLFAAGIVILIVPIFFTLFEYSVQIDDLEDLRKYDDLTVVYDEKAQSLTKEFAKYLADQYPEHERNIYQTIKPDKVDIYLAKYPDLNASKTIIALTDQIRQLQNDKYDQIISKRKTEKDLRFRQRNPWIFNSFIPAYPQ